MSEYAEVSGITATSPADNGQKTVTLSAPIAAHGEVTTTLTLREPRAADLRQIRLKISDEGLTIVMGDLLDTAARCAGVPLRSFDALALRDVGALVEAMLDFFDGSLPIGTS